MIETFTLSSPYFLFVLPLFIFLNYLYTQKYDVYYMPHTQYYTKKKISPSLLKSIVKWIMLSFAIVALCDPVYYKKTAIVKKNVIDIVLALDSSGSMSTYGFNPDDYKQTRLDVVKEIVTSFIGQRTNDRIGLVLFGTYSAIASPLSFDKEAQTHIVKNLNIGTLGKSTALIDALVSSVKILKESTSHSKVIILLSDGEDSSSKAPLSIVLKLLKKYHIKVYTIIIDKSNSNIMQLISKSSGTKAYSPKDKKALKAVYQEIDTLETSNMKNETIKIPQHIYGYFLGFSLLLGFVLLFLSKNEEIF